MTNEEPVVVTTWRGFVEKVLNSHGQCFRGVLATWNLESSFERVADSWKIAANDRAELERRLLREFQRAYPHDIGMSVPEDDDELGWFTLMQHHGAPTRLLDWTYSPYVAAYFALKQSLSVPRSPAAVWMIDSASLRRANNQSSTPSAQTGAKQHPATSRFHEVFKTLTPTAGITAANPYRLHARLVIQQGLFLYATDVARSFQSNLDASDIKPSKIDLRFNEDELNEAFTQLRRMNVDEGTLFPGIDGFARSLVTRARHLLELPLSE